MTIDPVELALSTIEATRTDPRPDEPDNRTGGANAAPLSEIGRPESCPDDDRTMPALALEPDILGRFRADLLRAGVAGEETLASLVYLAVTSRLLPWGRSTERPVSVIPKGTTSTGKSHATRTTLKFFPPSAYVDLGSMSRKYLFYSEDSFEHRFVYVPEWASIKEDDELVALLRVLLSEGHIVHGTVDINRQAQVITKEGPTGLLMTTTDAAVDVELETRCLTIVTDDTPEQTRRVFRVLADLEDDADTTVELTAWRDFQDWLANRPARTVVPFVRALAELFPDGATRLRRDFGALLSLVRAHALLYQAQRDRDDSDRIVATVEGDYAPVRELVGDLIAQGAEASAADTTHVTVAAVRELQAEGADHVSPKALAERLGVGRSATYDRIRRALLDGYLVNLAGRDERGMRLVVGATLPGSEDFLPLPADVVRLSSGDESGLANVVPMRDSDVMSGRPARPADPQLELDEGVSS